MHPTISYPAIRWFRLPAALLCSLLLMATAGCSVFGGASVEEAPYELVNKDEQFEVRDYAAVVVAQTEVAASFDKAGNTAFRRLFNYISGENEGSEKIAMTAPVIAENDESGSSDSGEKIAMTAPVSYQKEGDMWRYRFVLPRTFTMENAPRPTNPDVSLFETEPRRVATIRYAWLATDKARAKNAQSLMNWIESQGLVAQSEPRWAGYNPPWTLPPFRRNEVLVDVATQ